MPGAERFRPDLSFILCLSAMLVGLGCAGAATSPSSEASRDSSQQPAPGPKRITVAIAGEPHTLYQKLNPQSTVRGIEELEQLVHTGFTTTNATGVLVAQLAEAVPSIENGLWRVLGDGRMELTWTIRDELVDSLQSGLTPVAHSFVSPEDPTYPHVESSIVRFAYDPRRAAQLIEGLGYSKAADGVYHDSAGSRLTVEIRATGTDINQKTMLSVGDHWKRLGVESELVAIPPQLASDLEYRALFPGFAVQRQGAALTNMRNFTSAQAPLPANRWVGANYPRYMNPEFDALVDRFDATLLVAERMVIGAQVIRHLTDQVIELPLFFDGQPTLVSNRLVALTAGGGGQRRTAWNAHAWDLR